MRFIKSHVASPQMIGTDSKRPVCLAASLIIPGSMLAAIILLLPFFSSQLTCPAQAPRLLPKRPPPQTVLQLHLLHDPNKPRSIALSKKKSTRIWGTNPFPSASVSNTSPNMTARSSPSQKKCPPTIWNEKKHTKKKNMSSIQRRYLSFMASFV